MPLTSKQKQYLRSLAHSMKPVILIGSAGLSEGLLAELEAALDHHELIKLKIASGDRNERRQMLDEICSRYQAELVQLIGRTATIYRQGENKKIAFPK